MTVQLSRPDGHHGGHRPATVAGCAVEPIPTVSGRLPTGVPNRVTKPNSPIIGIGASQGITPGSAGVAGPPMPPGSNGAADPGNASGLHVAPRVRTPDN